MLVKTGIGSILGIKLTNSMAYLSLFFGIIDNEEAILKMKDNHNAYETKDYQRVSCSWKDYVKQNFLIYGNVEGFNCTTDRTTYAQYEGFKMDSIEFSLIQDDLDNEEADFIRSREIEAKKNKNTPSSNKSKESISGIELDETLFGYESVKADLDQIIVIQEQLRSKNSIRKILLKPIKDPIDVESIKVFSVKELLRLTQMSKNKPKTAYLDFELSPKDIKLIEKHNTKVLNAWLLKFNEMED